ncbi:hypothetical protein [Plantactinospora sp. GCM10030261]|uniref:hypothetical protein n=1 Tax=Plantactinospora sp. GCM10030261 TaxID=3273420 RepID=UPI003610E3E1
MTVALTPASWVTRWLMRSIAMLAATAFTALALALGAGTAAVPAVVASPASGPATATQPARVTVADGATLDLSDERATERQTTAAPRDHRTDRQITDAVVPVAAVADLVGLDAARSVGERAPPGR